MTKLTTLAAALALVALLAAPALSQDRMGGKAAATECDLKTVEKAKWCEKCDKVLGASDIDKDGKHKGDCNGKAKDIELCIKKHFCCEQCGVDVNKAGTCPCGKKFEEKNESCKVIYICTGCEGRSPVAADIKHDEDKHKESKKAKAAKRTCEESGNGRHVAAK